MTEQEFEAKRAAICAEFDRVFAQAQTATYDSKYAEGWRERESALVVPAREKKKAALAALEAEFYGIDFPGDDIFKAQ